MQLLRCLYLESDDIYVAIPIHRHTPQLHPSFEFVFDTEEEQQDFLKAYYKNQMAAVAGYHIMQEQKTVQQYYNAIQTPRYQE